jgi:hypothetical protein
MRVSRRLASLRELGVTAIELMPVADFAGGRNWGYDGVLPFAPDSSYGRPEDLKALVDAAHSAASRCCSTSSTTTSAPRATTCRLLAAADEPAPRDAVGARPSTSTTTARTWCAISSRRTRCTGCATTASTVCASTRCTSIRDDGAPATFLRELADDAA